jgi:hypothetical protein
MRPRAIIGLNVLAGIIPPWSEGAVASAEEVKRDFG